MSETTMRPNVHPLCLRDPWAKLIFKVTSFSFFRSAALSLAFSGVLIFAAGFLISAVYEASGYKFLTLYDLRELSTVLFINLVIVPIIWGTYAWQPTAILNVLDALHSRGVIDEADAAASFDSFVKQNLIQLFNRRYNLVIVVVVTVVAVLIWVQVATTPGPFHYGFPTTWVFINPFYFWLIFVPLAFINVHMTMWIILRQGLAIYSFRRFFRTFRITPRLFHPDQCNGLAAIGNFAIRCAWVAVFLGFWVAAMISVPALFGQTANLTFDTVAMLVMYVLLVPALLIPPAWGAHVAMRTAKYRALETVATQIRELLSNADVERETTTMNLVEILERKYRLLDKEYRTWPFPVVALRTFSLTALLPILSTVLSLLLDLVI